MAVHSDTNEVEGDIIEPSALVLPRIADATEALKGKFLNAPTGSICYDNNTGKIGLVTVTKVSEETVAST